MKDFIEQRPEECSEELSRQSQKPFNYQVFYTRPKATFNSSPFYQSKGVPTPRYLVNHESDLKNLPRKLSEYDPLKYPFNSIQAQTVIPETKNLSTAFKTKDKGYTSEIPLDRFE